MMILRMLFLSNAMTGRPAMGRELTGEQGLGNRAAKPVPKRKGAAGKPSTPFCFFGPEEAGKKLTSWLLPSRPWRRRQLPAQRRQLRPPCRWRWRRRRQRRDRQSVVVGEGVSVSVDVGGRSTLTQKNKTEYIIRASTTRNNQ